MTILNKKMTTLAINSQKHLSVNEEHFGDSIERNRGRSERASSLALPHSSLLDFYDKQQEQCNSVALLPTSVNVVVRRHSSHYYPMLEEKPPVHHQQQQQQQQSQLIADVPQFNYNNKINQLALQEMQSIAKLPSHIVNTNESKYSVNTATSNSSTAVKQCSVAATPPPPIPKRTFRSKSAWSSVGTSGETSASASPTATQTPTKGKHGQYTSGGGGTAFVYPQQLQHQEACVGGGYYSAASSFDSGGNSHAQSLFVDIATRPLYTDVGLDAGVISDDDRMSLENSVFDESLTSTPVKVGNNANSGRLANANFAAKTLAALTNDLSSAAKRSNRSSSSTVDSTITTSSGYGSAHSERFASTSTTADFRSRFSSVDTQSSLDSCIAEKAQDSPLSKDSFKMERSTLHDVIHDYNNSLNNNEVRSMAVNTLANSANNNNTPVTRAFTLTSEKMPRLPAVPARKSQTMIPPPTQNNGQPPKALSSVSASTSTSSTVSVGSGTTSGSGNTSGSSMSISATASNTAISPLTHNSPSPPQPPASQKRPVPPTPPARSQNSFDSGKSDIIKPPPLTVRNKLTKPRPPPIVYPKLHQRQDSNLSNDSFSVTSSPGYNSKNMMDAPLLQNAARINKSGVGMSMRQQDPSDGFGMTSSRYVFANAANPMASQARSKFSYRQDSNISSDSFSQTSSPGYNTKLLEAPLLPSLSVKRLCGVPAPIVCKQKFKNETIEELEQSMPVSPLTKCVSTPASLQTIVRYQNGAPNTMSLDHQRQKGSKVKILNIRHCLYFAVVTALMHLAFFGIYSTFFSGRTEIKYVNKTIINTVHVEDANGYGKNPSPGTCLPIIVKFCQGPQIPYNFTVFPNYIGHFGQLETQVDLDSYEALVDVRCYELVSLFLCTLFVPKCGSTGATVPPCKTLCTETMRRCGFFFDVFSLSLPEYLNCKLFKDFESADECVGLDQVRDVMIASTNPKCEGFQCDQNRCIPQDYVCDGHLDCMDQTDEANCERCAKDEIYCGDDRCVTSKHICDGIVDCPYGQDERNCIRLSERNGDLGKGVLEVFRISSHEWTPACVKNWDRAVSPTAVCSMLGYNSVNATSVVTQKTHRPLLTSVNVSTDIWKMYAKKRSNLMQEFSNCKPTEDYPIAELTCTSYECGKVKSGRHKPSRRIIGGSKANPGSWPFLAAILGGPEKIFYCAGVLISDQWVLTASHCIGNHTVIDLEDWTIQLGVTRRNSFTYSGQKVKVKTVIPHPQYNTAITHDNDIALFQLSTRVAFHEHLLPVCLPPPSLKQLKPDQLCTVIGWGKREDNDPKSTYEPIVNEAQVPIIRRQQCDEWLDNLTVSEGMICAGYEEGGKDACQGDSGGPLLCPYPGEKDRWFVGGIVSWGVRCAHPKLPGVYANVIKYVPWIQEQMQKYSKPVAEDKASKYDAHPGGPDILSNMAAPGPMRNKKNYNNQNRSPMDIDYYESLDKP